MQKKLYDSLAGSHMVYYAKPAWSVHLFQYDVGIHENGISYALVWEIVSLHDSVNNRILLIHVHMPWFQKLHGIVE